ncbi:MAG: hypothetical protein H6722_09770 [Sandaracinus sp.]|nr:hypothetical protein [Sandaracinus sp.]
MRTLSLAGLSLLVLSACGGDDGNPSDVDAGSGFDAGTPVPDAALPDGAVPPMPDGGSDGGTDAGMDAGPPCECPTLPTTCEAPTPLVFGPADPDFRAQLFQVIACADETLDLAVYLSSWDCLADAVAARLTAVPALQVRIVVDDDLCPVMGATRDCALGALAGHPRVTFADDDRSALMHHKYVIADGELAWVSSANFSYNSFCEESNVSVVVDDAAIVAGLEAELDRFVGGAAGPIVRTPSEGTAATLYFSPETPVTMSPTWFRALETAFSEATASIDVMIYSFTRTELSTAMLAARDRGVTVRVLTSYRFRNEAPIQALRAAGIEVRATDVHQKTAVIDGQTLILGSANWSMNAWESNENSLWLRDAAMAEAASDELDRLWAAAEVITD